MDKKKLLTACVLGACVTLQSLCAAGTQETEQKVVGKPSGTINFYYWDTNQTEAMNDLIALFNKQYPDITVVPTTIPSGEYWTKLKTALATGTGPDVFWMNMTVPDYINAKLLYDMTDRIKQDGVDMSKFPKLLRDLYSKDGHIYGMPKDYDGIGLFYNKEIFDEMGVAYPRDGMSWDELLDVAKKTTNADHYGFIAQNTGNVCYQDFVYSNGGRISSADNIGCEIDEAPAIEAIQYLHDMMYVSKVSPTYAEQQEVKPNDMFVGGRAAMITAGSWKMNSFKKALGDKLGITTMPVSKTPAITVHGLAYCIAAKSKNLEAAWEFVKFCGTKEAQEVTAKGAIPAYEGVDQVWAASNAKYNAAKLLEGVNYPGSLGNPWWDKHYTDANTILKNAMTTIWSMSDIDIPATLSKCAADIEAVTK